MRPFLSLLFATSVLLPLSIFAAPDDDAGTLPKAADGRALNLDFETGTLQDWTASGKAFDGQPIDGDTVSNRRSDMRSGHQSRYWVGTFERGGDDLQGTLTSAPFKVTAPWASFLVGGGPNAGTRVELVRQGEKEEVFFRISGVESENLRAVVVNLEKEQGKEISVRVIDQQTGHWGHVNFDNFRLHAQRPKFTNELTPVAAAVAAAPPSDDVKFSGLPALQAAQEMTLPPGFKATLFAGEPDVKQPIAFCLDDRGRLWVAEGYTYPRRKGNPPSAISADGKPDEAQLADIFGSNDRILVFEDSNGDGSFDKRTVFLDKLNLVSGLEVGFGGVWIGAAPYLMFVPVTDWDAPKPAGNPRVLLDGWDYTRDTHETLNTFTWGPDGWLYGCHGVFCPSNVGKPGTPKEERQWVDAAVWRYHPTKQLFEIFSEGTSNPWGIDYDANGQFFIEACVIPHLFHMVQGGRYQRQGGAHYAANALEKQRFNGSREGKSEKTLNPYVYDDIKTIADHVHYAGSKGPHAGNGRSDAAGGGHAHAGLLIYQGDNFPAEYRGNLFMNNIHGQRINMDIPEAKGSGFVGRHGKDFINFNDRWSQVLNLLSGPDGSVYMIDWYDKNQCHHNDLNGHDRGNGRIFRVSYGQPEHRRVDLAKASNAELINLLTSNNAWHARHAQRLLQERAAHGSEKPDRAPLITALKERSGRDALRALWALHLTGGLDESLLREQLAKSDPMLRAWAVQLACEDRKPSPALLDEFSRMAREDASPVVRLYLASALQRMPLEQRGPILRGLLSHAEDAGDHNLPLMYWWAAEPLVAQDTRTAVGLLGQAKIPQVREFITRRMAAAAASKSTAATR